MADNNDQHLGNDAEVIQLPADLPASQAGWGEDAAVVEVAKEG
jgi:hypothetical protein